MITRECKNIQEKGYLVQNINECKRDLNKLRNSIIKINSTIAKREIISNEDVIKFRAENERLQFQALRLIWNSSAMYSIASNPFFENFLIKKLNYKCPIHNYQPLLRCDMPLRVDKQSIFKQHQDFTYNDGSKNSITIWIPLQDTGYSEGALNVAEGSHNTNISKDNIFPHKNGIINEQYEFNFKSIPVKFGQAIFFNQKLVHKSGINTSKNIRYSVLLRFSDLDCDDFANKGYPILQNTSQNKFVELKD